MQVTLRWNRLTIVADTEPEFIQAVNEYFPQMIALPYEEVELDVTRSKGITEESFRSIAIKLVSGEHEGKKLLIRIPDTVERYFRHAGLYRICDIDVVRKVAAPENKQYTREIIKDNIESGKFDTTEQEARMGAGTTIVNPQQYKTVYSDPLPAPQPTSPQIEVLPEDDDLIPLVRSTASAFLVDTETGARHTISDTVTIGREAPADIVYQIPTISKKHFIIRRAQAGFLIEDLHSTNGTYLNGLPVHEPVPIRDGDEVVVAITLKHPKGARIFTFHSK